MHPLADVSVQQEGTPPLPMRSRRTLICVLAVVLIAVGLYLCSPRANREEPPVAAQAPGPPAAAGARQPLEHMRDDRPAMRAAGLRLKAFHAQDYYVSYKPDPELRIKKLDDVLAGRKLGAEVHPFVQTTSAYSASGFDAERGAEIVVLAIARQLETMGWSVVVVPGPAMLESVELQPSPTDLGDVLARLVVMGEVRFVVSTQRRKDAYVTTARIASNVVFLVEDATAPRELFAGDVEASAQVTGQQAAGRTKRARQAAEKVLGSFIHKLFTNPQLRKALVNEVRKRVPQDGSKSDE